MLLCYNNFKGDYGPDTQFTQSEKSRVFVKITKTKVLAAYSKIIQVLFGNGEFPITVDQTKLPEGVVDTVSFDPMAPPTPPTPQEPLFSPNRQLPPGATIHNMQQLGPLASKLEPVKDRLIEGEGTTPTAVSFHPAYVAAKRMEKKIKDQLEESNASKHLKTSAFEMCLFGTGVLKGPFAIDKEYSNWDEKGNYTPVFKTVPALSSVSVWNFYPDPDSNNMDEAEYVVERHKLSLTQLIGLKSRPFFRDSIIDKVIERGPNYEMRSWENAMNDDNSTDHIERWEALEYWGYIPVEKLREKGLKIPKKLKDFEVLNVNVWICGNEILRLVMNPFKPTRIPYHAAPYEINPYSFFGIGVADNMEDSQMLMNGFMRMAVDNAVLSGNLVFEIHEDNFSNDQDLEIYPGKVFRRQSGPPGQGLFATEFPNVANQNMQLFDKARQLADEATGIPSFSHGQTGVTGTGRTASGISMLMDAASDSDKAVISNLDDFLLGPLGRAFFAFNMQFDHSPDIKGDLEVNARGTESLMANEVRSQRLMQFLTVVSSNPMLAPFAKLDVIVREVAKSLDLDPDRVTNSLPDAAVQAEVLKQFQAGIEQAQAGTSPGNSGKTPAPGLDMSSGPGSGGGQMGTGSVPAPGTNGFSANKGPSQ